MALWPRVSPTIAKRYSTSTWPVWRPNWPLGFRAQHSTPTFSAPKIIRWPPSPLRPRSAMASSNLPRAVELFPG
ncbi:hypothetical protein G6F24_001361 [Rhizopus arrhizus]|nr:hypothetical protein G6F24_001361 [Rhizopus arrhizus]